MRVLIIIMALAYWGLALLAQFYLTRGGEAPAFDAAEINYNQGELAAEIATCGETRDNNLLVAASFDAAAEPDNNAPAC